jgi:6-phosphogluconolactonase
MEIHIADDAQQIARDFAVHLSTRINEQEKFTIALSGGSTPAVLFRLLADEYKDKIDWSKMHFFWGDERCVPPEDEQSNFKMANDLLLSKVPVRAAQIYRVRGEAEPAAEAGRYGAAIRSVVDIQNGLPAFDLIMLGMGSDGHTASIFPDQMELLQDTQICAVAVHPESKQQRVTFTGQLINNAREVAFLVTGDSKKDKIEAIVKQVNDYDAFPAAHIVPAKGTLHWYLDRAAAAGLTT